MRTYGDFAELARLCWRQSHLAQTPGVALLLRQMAREYQEKAEKLVGGNPPGLGVDAKPVAEAAIANAE
jgi:hypothetical protein